MSVGFRHEFPSYDSHLVAWYEGMYYMAQCSGKMSNLGMGLGVGEASSVYNCFNLRLTFDTQQW